MEIPIRVATLLLVRHELYRPSTINGIPFEFALDRSGSFIAISRIAPLATPCHMTQGRWDWCVTRLDSHRQCGGLPSHQYKWNKQPPKRKFEPNEQKCGQKAQGENNQAVAGEKAHESRRQDNQRQQETVDIPFRTSRGPVINNVTRSSAETANNAKADHTSKNSPSSQLEGFQRAARGCHKDGCSKVTRESDAPWRLPSPP